MSMPEILYVDDFNNADEFTIHQLTLTKSNQTSISKEKLAELARENGITVYSGMKKEQLAAAVYKVMGKSILKHCKHMGVAPFSFIRKFDLMRGEIEAFSRAGFLEITGDITVSTHGMKKTVNLYSAEQYFSLNEETIERWRAAVNETKIQ